MRSLRLRSGEGASAVEFVLILPVLVMLVFGIIQFGIAYNRSQGMHAAAREGARLAAIGADVGDIQARVRSALGGTLVNAWDVTSRVRWYSEKSDPANKGAGTEVTNNPDAKPCSEDGAQTVRIDVEVTKNVSSYAITIPFVPLPSSGQTFPSQAIFRCEDQA